MQLVERHIRIDDKAVEELCSKSIVGDCFAKSIIDSGSAFLPIKINII